MLAKDIVKYFQDNCEPDEEVIIAWWDKSFFVDSDNHKPEEIEKVWEAFAIDGQDTVNDHLEFTQTGWDLMEELDEKLAELVEADE